MLQKLLKMKTEVAEFKHITCAFLDETKYPETSNLAKKLQTYHNATIIRKKRGVACRFNAPWSPSYETRVFSFDEKIDETKAGQSSY